MSDFIIVCEQATKCALCEFAILPGQAMTLTEFGWTHATEVEAS